ncbi:MAG: hypothetical protein DRN26_02270 [Thermoplasmata archaeon]|nr:MAG: hypothetical protein DRN26_02270 [Thermoplasmata archaeon]
MLPLRRSRKYLREEKTYENLITTLEEISSENSSGKLLILVEGKNDLIALRKLGFNGPIKTIKGRKLSDLIDEVYLEYKRVLVLSDWDNEGERLYKEIRYLLESYGVRVEDKYRRIIKSITKREIKDVEGLLSFVKHINLK